MKTPALHICMFLIYSLPSGGKCEIDINQEIHVAYQHIAEAKTQDLRVEKMRSLIAFLKHESEDTLLLINDASVNEIALLLSIDGDIGRFYGAKALAAVGCRAKSALPALRQALTHAKPSRSDFEPLLLSPAVSPYEELETAITTIEDVGPCY